MKMWVFLGGLVLSGVFLATLITIKSKTDCVRRKVSRLLDQDNYEFLVLDIRTQELYRKSHIPGAVNVSPSEIDLYYPSEDMFLNIFVYSQKGINARRGVRCLSRNGYFQVASLGSFHMWKGIIASGEDNNESK